MRQILTKAATAAMPGFVKRSIKRACGIPTMRGWGYCAVRSLYNDAKTLINKDDPVIIDGGANRGDMTQRFIGQYANPTIYAFEPHPQLAGDLRNKFREHPDVNIVEKALSSKPGETTLNLASNFNSSSFCGMSANFRKYHGDKTTVTDTAMVKLTTLDEELSDLSEIDMIKLDLEGWELQALNGAETVLERTGIVITEVWFIDMYEGAPRFSEIEQYMRSRSFQLLNLYEPYTHKDMQLTSADALFVNKRPY